MMRSIMIALGVLAVGVSHAQTTAIVGGTVHTVGPQGTIENATVIIANGQILAVGANARVPDGAEVIDATGKVVTPGLFSPLGELGLVEVGASAGPVDSVQRGDAFTASFDIAESYNPRSTLIAVNRIEGVTRAAIMPRAAGPDPVSGNSHVISGLGAVINLGGDDSLVRHAAAMVVNLGEGGASLSGESRAQAWMLLRRALDEAVDYRDHGRAYELGQHREYAHSVADLTALQGVLARDIPLLVRIDRASDIRALLRLADVYEVRIIIASGVEAWMVADEIAAADVPVILAPEANLPSNFDRLNANEKNATVLVSAGVTVAFADGSATTHNARNITQSAGNAIVNGLSREQAMRAITLSPAEIYGVASSTGSIEIGKDADLVIWPGDPLELVNYPEAVFIRGEAVEMQSRQTLLRDRYRDTTTKTPPAYRNPAAN